jgi:acyl-CoA synthetase (AMP-forming)/AMP-acid ligase II
MGYELAIQSLDGRRLAIGEDGEVCLRGGNVMRGYWNRVEATDAALRDGWLHTGDIGHLDEDGYLYVVGRLKEVIRSGSSSIVPQEVEDAIALHPGVAEVAVTGLPDPEWQEIVAAFIVPRDGVHVTEAEIIEHCRTLLTAYKRPRAVTFLESLPRSHYGKVLKAQLVAGEKDRTKTG